MLSEAIKSPDVTLIPVDNVCKYNQFGFCKFGDLCRKPHVNELCKNLHCEKKLCLKRHPKECKYFATNNTCKFEKQGCAYKHVESINQSDIQKLSNDLKSLTSTIKEMMSKINQLELELYNVKKCAIVKTVKTVNENYFKCPQCREIFESEDGLKYHIERQHEEYKCEVCNYQATSSSTLKSHMNKKHCPSPTASPTDTAKIWSPPPSPIPQHVSTLFLKPSQYKFACSHCSYCCKSSKSLKMHTTRVHYPKSPISPKHDEPYVMINPPLNPLNTNPMATVFPNPDIFLSDNNPTSLSSLQETLSSKFRCQKSGT